MELNGRYLLEHRIGRGGMGEVWRGHDRELGRPVAVKLLLDLTGDARAIRRFQREAALAARLRDPAITTVHDVGVHEDRPFIVMELLDGTDLATRLAGAPGGLPAAEAVALAAQAARGLAAAHADGVVHRDLKPANLFLTAAGRLKICDFGLARAADAASALTVTGEVFGTPAYMAPEQARGTADERSDLYSLGCVLHELLTGRPPFPTGRPALALLLAHRDESPAGPRALRPDLSPELDRLVLDLLAKDPAARPATAAELADTLEAYPWAGAARPPASALDPVRAERLYRAVLLKSELDGDHRVLCRLAAAYADTDPERAARLFESALRDARRPYLFRDEAVCDVVVALAAFDPDGAEDAARTIEDDAQRARAKAGVAAAVAAADPYRAARLLHELRDPATLRPLAEAMARIPARDATTIIEAIRNPHHRVEAVVLLGRAVAPADPGRAEELLRAVGRETALVEALAADHPDRAEHVARSLTDPEPALGVLAAAAVDTDPARAARIAAELRRPSPATAYALAVGLSAAYPEHAERMFDLIPAKDDRIRARAAAAARVAAGDPDRAGRMLAKAIRAGRRIMHRERWHRVLHSIAGDIAGTYPDEAERIGRLLSGDGSGLAWVVTRMASEDVANAERIARSISEQSRRERALGRIAIALSTRDPDRAERIATSLQDRYASVHTLLDLADIWSGRPLPED
ncbi:protein kinase [Actinomadura sp. 21ATH]|uniref:serine/threonine-protein kinase n=1 Tax=Actinomadura sp. 21ATH TaxID=1735444 RepID=UPI0035C059CC